MPHARPARPTPARIRRGGCGLCDHRASRGTETGQLSRDHAAGKVTGSWLRRRRSAVMTAAAGRSRRRDRIAVAAWPFGEPLVKGGRPPRPWLRRGVALLRGHQGSQIVDVGHDQHAIGASGCCAPGRLRLIPRGVMAARCPQFRWHPFSAQFPESPVAGLLILAARWPHHWQPPGKPATEEIHVFQKRSC
jgi:hypothetical protein